MWWFLDKKMIFLLCSNFTMETSFQSSGFENLPSQFFDFENLPKEILPLIFGRLSFADLIMAKNVSRRFNIQCKPFIMMKLEIYNKGHKNTNKWVHTFSDICELINDGERFIVMDHRGSIAKEIRTTNFAYIINIWLFLLANNKIFIFADKIFDDLVTQIFNWGFINESMELFYIRKYLQYDSSTKNIISRYNRIWKFLFRSDINEEDFALYAKIINILKIDMSEKMHEKMLGDLLNLVQKNYGNERRDKFAAAILQS